MKAAATQAELTKMFFGEWEIITMQDDGTGATVPKPWGKAVIGSSSADTYLVGYKKPDKRIPCSLEGSLTPPSNVVIRWNTFAATLQQPPDWAHGKIRFR